MLLTRENILRKQERRAQTAVSYWAVNNQKMWKELHTALGPELPASYRKFPRAIYFTCGNVYFNAVLCDHLVPHFTP